MDPVLAQALATLAGAISTAILLASSYYWGPRQREKRAVARNELRRDETWTHENRMLDDAPEEE